MKRQKSHKYISPRWGTGRLRLLFLLPMTIAMLIIIFMLSIILYQHTSRNVEAGIIQIRTSAQNFYEESVRYDADALQAIMHVLKKDDTLSRGLADRNKELLLRHAKPLFEDLRHDYKITHFYFTGTDRVNLLRVHAPSRDGDIINRTTTLQAEASGTVSYGVELGPLGTFTLRLVSPWYDSKTNKLIGYVELGMEIDQVIQKLEKFFSVQVFTVIHKEFLDRDKWESGMRTLGRTPHWDRFPGKVISEQSMNLIPSFLDRELKKGNVGTQKSILELTYQGHDYSLTVLPLYDASSRSIAEMILLTDISEEEDTVRKTVYAGTITLLVMGGILLIFFYFLIGRIGRHIERSEKKLSDLATHDGLTGLYNHRFFYRILESEIMRASRYKNTVSLLMLDIDHFKGVNDTYGHQAGDAILRGLSERLMCRVRSIDSVCRYGGEEIMVVLPETDLLGAQKIAEDLRFLIENEAFKVCNNQSINITVSIGLSVYPEHAQEVSVLVSQADTALYQAKESGRNRICVYKEKDLKPIND